MNNLKKAYELGWIQASKWAEREDLIADIGSPTYVREADAALATQQSQAEPLESLLSIATGLLSGYEDRDGHEARKPYKPGSVIANFVDECVERLKDWPTPVFTQPSQADLEAENERLREGLEEMLNTFCSVENVADEHCLQVLRDAIPARESTK